MRKPLEYIKESWAIYTKKENFIFFAKINAVLLLASIPFSYAMGYFYPSNTLQYIYLQSPSTIFSFVLLVIASAIVGMWSQTTQIFSLLNMGDKESTVLRLGFKNIAKMFFLSIVVGLIVFGGMILLIIPGFIFAIWYSFSLYLVLDKKMTISEALRTSKLMVKGKFWKIIGRFFVFGLFGLLVSIIVSIVPLVGSLLVSFAIPLMSLPNYLFYRDLVVNN